MKKQHRPKKITLLSKEDINKLVMLLLKYKKISLSNFCVIELRENNVEEFFNVNTGVANLAPQFRVNIKKARYIKEEIARQSKSPLI